MHHLFFDLDGTLTNPAAGVIASMQHALRAMSRRPLADAQLLGLIGPPLREGFRRILATDDAELIETAVRHFRDRFGPVGIFENELYAGIPEVLGELQRAGHRMCIVTSKAAVYAERIVDHFGLRGFFGAVYASTTSQGPGRMQAWSVSACCGATARVSSSSRPARARSSSASKICARPCSAFSGIAPALRSRSVGAADGPGRRGAAQA